ncbi:stage V sporulation protein S [Alkalicoccus luteus]|uniref:Stage V sporulation protein S n=1 Tax=Alkalicoccus luteus TaxID=1237094 RepID=A0A969PRD7_9BACI|nr:stage V sporulation protein S [Alkalicoccus luteus]NJP38997.1 stage V sporulation protein S [Alkalicoccus luteus]
MTTYQVSSQTSVNKLAGAISHTIQADNPIKLQAVGAASINQAIKSVAVARLMVEEREVDLFVIPAFSQITIDEQPRTMIELTIHER